MEILFSPGGKSINSWEGNWGSELQEERPAEGTTASLGDCCRGMSLCLGRNG